MHLLTPVGVIAFPNVLHQLRFILIIALRNIDVTFHGCTNAKLKYKPSYIDCKEELVRRQHPTLLLSKKQTWKR